MKITRNQLRQIIKEEFDSMSQASVKKSARKKPPITPEQAKKLEDQIRLAMQQFDEDTVSDSVQTALSAFDTPSTHTTVDDDYFDVNKEKYGPFTGEDEPFMSNADRTSPMRNRNRE